MIKLPSLIRNNLVSISNTSTNLRLVSLRLHAPHMTEHGSRLRLLIRIAGYFISLVSAVSILTFNPALGINVVAIADDTVEV